MKRIVLATVAALGLVSAASAQSTSVTTSKTTTETTGSISIAPEQRTIIRQKLATTKPVTVKEKVTVGWTVPEDVELSAVPDTIVADLPSVKGYRYFVYNNDVVLVDPSTRKVVTIVE